MQNSPQFIVAFYAILRANAVVVPINPMNTTYNTTYELEFYIEDCGAKVAVIGQELYERISPVLQKGVLKHLIVAAYSDYLPGTTEFQLPEVVAAPRRDIDHSAVISWREALARGYQPGPVDVGADDLAVLPYTSGTTGKPKGCMHTHRTVQANIVCTLDSLEPGCCGSVD
jgi:fatty-acyl-CoA synthase